MKQFVYLLGPPGAGKTSAMRVVCGRGMKIFTAVKPVRHTGYMLAGKSFAVLGVDKAPFGGTDTLSYTAISDSEKWLRGLPDIVFAEGDRLATQRFFDNVRKIYSLTLVYLNCPEPVLDARRKMRAKEFDLPLQAEEWVRGRGTKHRRLAEEQGAIFVDALEDSEAIADFIWTLAGEQK